MADIPAELQVINQRVSAGETPTTTVRSLMLWFTAS